MFGGKEPLFEELVAVFNIILQKRVLDEG